MVVPMKTHFDRNRRMILALAVSASACSWAAAPAGAAAPAAAAPPAHAAGPLPFLQDDYPKALAQAKARNAPLFLDFWAPW
jgi:thiol:disulfide interchange protein